MGSPEVEVEVVARKAGEPGFGGLGRSSGLRPLVLSCFALKALNRVENLPSLVTVGSDEPPTSRTVPSLAVGVGEGDPEGGDMPSKH